MYYFLSVPDIQDEPDGEGWLTTRAPRAPSRRLTPRATRRSPPPPRPASPPRRGVRRARSPSPQTRSERMRIIVDDMVASLNPEMLSELVMSINRRMRNSLRRSPFSPTRPPSSRATRTQTSPSTSQPSTSSTQTSGCGGLPPISSVLLPRRSPPPTRTAPTSTTSSSTISSRSSRAREGAVAGAPVSSSAEGGCRRSLRPLPWTRTPGTSQIEPCHPRS